MDGLENEVNLALVTEGSATDDFDVDALLDLGNSDSFPKVSPKPPGQGSGSGTGTGQMSINTSSKMSLMNDNNFVDHTAQNSLSPKASKSGKKPLSGNIEN
jgi:hypothetical protein